MPVEADVEREPMPVESEASRLTAVLRPVEVDVDSELTLVETEATPL